MKMSFKKDFAFYARHHVRGFTKFTHVIGVPLVIFAMQLFLDYFFIFGVSGAWVAVILLVMYYLFLDKPLAIMAGLYFCVITTIAIKINQHWQSTAALMIWTFILGWIIQFIGHFHEKSAPAFFKNIFQMLMAPLFLMAELCFLFNYRRDLHMLGIRSKQTPARSP